MRHTTRFALLAALVGAPLAYALPAEACGGLFCRRAPVDQSGERILFAADGKTVSAYVQIQYTGSAAAFSWIVPVPTTPKLGLGTNALFTNLRSVTRPTFNLELTTEGECKKISNTVSASAPMAKSTGSMASGVSVVSQEQLGAFDAVVLEATDAEELKKWLKENDYDIPAKVDPLLDPYVAAKYKFVALKLAQKATVGDIQPIVMTYESTKPGVPIRLTGVAATDDMDVFVWVLGKDRAIPENYRHAQINEARIDWLNSGSNYRNVVLAAMNEAGGQAFVTDYAGDADGVQVPAAPEGASALEALKQISDPIAFIDAVKATKLLAPSFQRGQPSSNDSEIGFYARYIKKPEAAKDVSDSEFYGNLAKYEAQLKAEQIVADGPKAAEELDERFVAPAKLTAKLFKDHKYLTGLYTAMSPEEMTQDPMFVFNPEMSKVSAVHTAKGVIKCSSAVTFSEAPIEITLANGIKYMVSRRSGGGDGTQVALPAAQRIEQLKASGAASIIKDNKPSITATLGDINGGGGLVSVDGAGAVIRVAAPAVGGVFGCMGCSARTTPPITQGLGEFATYGLFGIGVLGYRRRLNRKK